MPVWRNFPHWVQLKGDLDRIYGDLFVKNTDEAESLGRFTPAVDIEEDDKSYLLFFEIPGLKKEDVKITFQDGRVTVSGEKKITHNKNLIHHRSERESGTFCRTFNIASTIQTDKISAVFENGILNITLPKKAESRSSEIHINIS
jgi:HSP20 family protein